MELQDVINKRRSVKQYEPYEMDREAITKLLNKASLSPSAWNLQQWKVIVAHSDEAKETLNGPANKRIKTKESGATFIVLGYLNDHNTICDIADDWIKHNHIPAEKREGLIQSVNTLLEDETNKRD